MKKQRVKLLQKGEGYHQQNTVQKCSIPFISKNYTKVMLFHFYMRNTAKISDRDNGGRYKNRVQKHSGLSFMLLFLIDYLVLSAGIERATEGAVTRQQLRPDDWPLIWPELADSPEQIKNAVQQKVATEQAPAAR